MPTTIFQSQGKVKEEAMYINKSLSFLEQAVIALADRRRDHVPFRQSKLTHVLKDSIGGSCDTVGAMVSCTALSLSLLHILNNKSIRYHLGQD